MGKTRLSKSEISSEHRDVVRQKKDEESCYDYGQAFT